ELEVPAPQTQDRSRRRPTTRRVGGHRPVAHRRVARPGHAAAADAHRRPPGIGRPTGGVPEPHPRPVRRPGVAHPTRAAAVAAHLGDPHRFASAKQVGAYAGLVPRQYQSGVTDRKGRITRRGPGVLRKLLVECAWCMLRYNPWARAQYARLTAGGTTRK